MIACARYRIYDVRAHSRDHSKTHVLFIINLLHHVVGSTFVGFQGDPWISAHIDELRTTSVTNVVPHEAVRASISQVFAGSLAASRVLEGDTDEVGMDAVFQKKGMADQTDQMFSLTGSAINDGDFQDALEVQHGVPSLCIRPDVSPQYARLYHCIQAATSLYQQYVSKRRATQRVEILLSLIPRIPCYPPGKLICMSCGFCLIISAL